MILKTSDNKRSKIWVCFKVDNDMVCAIQFEYFIASGSFGVNKACFSGGKFNNQGNYKMYSFRTLFLVSFIFNDKNFFSVYSHQIDNYIDGTNKGKSEEETVDHVTCFIYRPRNYESLSRLR